MLIYRWSIWNIRDLRVVIISAFKSYVILLNYTSTSKYTIIISLIFFFRHSNILVKLSFSNTLGFFFFLTTIVSQWKLLLLSPESNGFNCNCRILGGKSKAKTTYIIHKWSNFWKKKKICFFENIVNVYCCNNNPEIISDCEIHPAGRLRYGKTYGISNWYTRAYRLWIIYFIYDALRVKNY